MRAAAANVAKEINIKHILIVGETAVLPGIKEVVKTIFPEGRMPDKWLPRFCTVAKGCAK